MSNLNLYINELEINVKRTSKDCIVFEGNHVFDANYVFDANHVFDAYHVFDANVSYLRQLRSGIFVSHEVG